MPKPFCLALVGADMVTRSLHLPAALASDKVQIGHGIPLPTILRQVAPWDACPGYVQHCVYKPPVTLLWRSPCRILDRFQDFGNVCPRLISEYQSCVCHPIPL